MQPLDPERLKSERHDVDLGTDTETEYGHAGHERTPARDGTAATADIADQKGASQIPNPD